MKNTLSLYIKNHQIGLTWCLLFLLIVCLLGLPYTSWWFCGGDDFHAFFLASKAKNLKDLLFYFIDGHVNQLQAPSNGISSAYPSFFSCYYRPLHRIYLTLQYWCFADQAYYYFICNIFFHALNTVLLFTIFRYFSSYPVALIGALFFALHPQIGYRFGAIANLQYYTNVCSMLLCILAFRNYLDTNRMHYYILSCLLFGTTLFTRETYIFLPGLFLLGTFLYCNKNNVLSTRLFVQQLPTLLRSTAGLWTTAFVYITWRLYLYPLTTNTTHTITCNPLQVLATIPSFFMLKKQEFLVCLYDALGLSWLPWGHPILRLVLAGCISTLLLWLFIRSTQKFTILFLLLSTTIMLWPMYVGCYSPRYMYEALPFLIAAYAFTFTYTSIPLSWIKRVSIIFFGLLLAFYFWHTIDCFKRREEKMRIMQHAAIALAHNPTLHNRTLLFVGYPSDGFGGHPAHLFWVLLRNPNIPILCDPATAITQADSNIIVPATWRNTISSYFTENYHTLRVLPDRLILRSENPQKIQFFLNNSDNCSLGKKEVLEVAVVEGNRVTTSFILSIDKQYITPHPLLITWDYQIQQFITYELPQS